MIDLQMKMRRWINIIKPKGVDDCVYFTNRTFDNGRVLAWVLKKECKKCKSGFMIKPLKKGKPDKKSLFYVCANCNNQEENSKVEADLILNVE